MKRPSVTHVKPKNEVLPVSEIQGKAKSGKEKAKPRLAGVDGGVNKVYHSKPHSKNDEEIKEFNSIDTDLAFDNLENDLPEADMQDL